MNRVICRRFTRGLFSCFLLLVLFGFGYSPKGTAVPAFAADDPLPINKKESSGDPPPVNKKESSKEDLKDGSGSSKELADRTHAVISKQVIEEEPLDTSKRPTPEIQPRIDTSKGILNLPSELNTENELVEFQATAYCLKGRTASGVNTRPGVIAADPRVLPLGTVVHIRAGRYTGTYTVLDTGGLIKGHTIDIFLPDYVEAKRFGRQRIKVKVLRQGRRPAHVGCSHGASVAKAL
ncbi:MAG TPA: 3D domain-containing protein [Blastocatellia bacterium]|jgi:rare lipoprotein A|nr:3D domain-containing protein [Blastocatellia bacterium]